MATYSKIPVSTIGIKLSTLAGSTTGKLLNSANIAIKGYYTESIEVLEKKIEEATLTGSEIEQQVESIGTALEQLRTHIRNVQELLTITNNTASTLLASTVALEVAIAALKVLPIPQVSLVVAVTVVFSDTLETLSQLASQLKEIATTLVAVCSSLLLILSPVLNNVENIIRKLDLLTIAGSTQSILDELEFTRDILTGNYAEYALQINDIPSSVIRGDLLSSIGEERYDIQTLNQLINNTDFSQKNNVRLVGNVSEDIANLKNYYKLSNDITFSRVSEYIENLNKIYTTAQCTVDTTYSVQRVKKLLNSIKSSNSYVEELRQIDNSLDSIKQTGIVDSNGSLQPFMSVVKKLSITSDSESSSKIYEEGLSFLNKLEYSGVGDGVRKQLEATLTVSSSKESTQSKSIDMYYRTRSDRLLVLNIVTDTDSPKIAPSRYVTATDESGTVVYTGTKSFTTDDATLIEEAKLRLLQLIG